MFTRRGLVAGLAGAPLLIVGLLTAAPRAARADAAPPPRSPLAVGTGGAVASVDPDASRIGVEVLREGGNAADAAIAAAAALGVTEPYSSGVGGGGYLVYREARTGRVVTIDGREIAPASFTPTVFTGASGAPLDFATVVSSGLSVGAPGTPALWDLATRRLGTWPLGRLLAPAEKLARDGFVVDPTFAAQSAANADRFRRFPATAALFLPGGAPPAVGSIFRNPDLAQTYEILRRQGVDAVYHGALGRAIVAAEAHPATAPGVTVLPGQLTLADLAAYRPVQPAPTHLRYHDLDVYGMAPSSSGGTTVGEALNLLEAYDRITRTPLATVDDAAYLHRLSEASATAFADRNRWIGSVPGVPVGGLLARGYADARACALFDPAAAHPRPLPFGDPTAARPGDSTGRSGCDRTARGTVAAVDDEGTTHLTVADRWGNVASYTLTIEQIGGSGITVPGYGFLLNNELTDFDFTPAGPGVPDPNLPGPRKRPRSSMSPTVITRGGDPWLALGSPGGATIITTVLQVLTEYTDRGRSLVDAIAAPRLSSRNGRAEDAEPAIEGGATGAALRALGHVLTANPEIGAATAVRILPAGRFEAAAETSRRGGGSALVAHPDVHPGGRG
ncbi:MAG TPA: gamma-glutamyltransferase family protein [Kineosporiaceae bacterium]